MKIERSTLTMRRPDNWHFHLRQAEMLKKMIPFANQFGRVVVMPNTDPPIDDDRSLICYRDEIMRFEPKFEPVMSVLLTKRMTPAMLRGANEAGAVLLKVLSGGTTNSELAVGLEEIENYYHVLAEAKALDMPVSIHAERSRDKKTLNLIPEIDREFMALPDLEKIMNRFPGLRIVFEHMSDHRSVNFFLDAKHPKLATTVTIHHLYKTLHDTRKSSGEIKDPHLICKPCLKLLIDLYALRSLTLSGLPNVFLGSDTAAHPLRHKLGVEPKAGIFISHPIELSAQFFETFYRLDLFEPFTSENGARFYSYPLNQKIITLEKSGQVIPAFYGESRSHPDALIPFMAGEVIDWTIINDNDQLQ